MKAFKMYGWVLQIIGAALLVGLSLFLEFGNGEDIVVPFIGALMVLAAIIRLVPYVKSQRSDLVKTINIIEITIDVALGLALILIPLITEVELGNMFGYLIGIYLMLRGAVHFFGVSEKKEESDLPIYLFHVSALIVGSYVFFSGNFNAGVLIHLILFFSVVSGGYLSWESYKGYKVYRYQKTLTMPDQPHADAPVDGKRVPAQDKTEKEVPVQDHVS